MLNIPDIFERFKILNTLKPGFLKAPKYSALDNHLAGLYADYRMWGRVRAAANLSCDRQISSIHTTSNYRRCMKWKTRAAGEILEICTRFSGVDIDELGRTHGFKDRVPPKECRELRDVLAFYELED